MAEHEYYEWWMLSTPLEIAVMRRMGIWYPTRDELVAHNGDPRPLPDPQIVDEEEQKLKAGVYASPDVALAAGIWGAVMAANDDDDGNVD